MPFGTVGAFVSGELLHQNFLIDGFFVQFREFHRGFHTFIVLKVRSFYLVARRKEDGDSDESQDGSNVLFTKPFQGAVIKMVTKGIAKLDEDADNVWLNVAAGEKWEDFVEHCIQNQYYGVENLIGIPGLVGSSPVQNIGAYGVDCSATSGWSR